MATGSGHSRISKQGSQARGAPRVSLQSDDAAHGSCHHRLHPPTRRYLPRLQPAGKGSRLRSGASGSRRDSALS